MSRVYRILFRVGGLLSTLGGMLSTWAARRCYT